MSLRSAMKKRLDVPGEKGAWIEIQPITASIEAAAEFAAQSALMQSKAGLRNLLSALSPEQVQALSKRHEEVVAEDWIAAKLNGLDLAILINGSVTAWSYDEDLSNPADQLISDTARWLGRQIVELNWRPPAIEQDSGTS